MPGLLNKQIITVDMASNLPSMADDGQLAFIRDAQVTVFYALTDNIWLPLSRATIYRSSTVVNGMATGLTKIFTTPNIPFNFYPTQVTVRAVTMSGNGTAPVINVGSNPTNYNNIATSGLINSIMGLMTSSNAPSLSSFSPSIPKQTDIYANVTTSSLLYSAYSIKFDISGFYDPN